MLSSLLSRYALKVTFLQKMSIRKTGVVTGSGKPDKNKGNCDKLVEGFIDEEDAC
jgi:hypothetical protein